MSAPAGPGIDADHFLYRLLPPRPSFATDMSEREAAVMQEHAGYWREHLERGTAVVFGPVLDPAGTWGLAVVHARDAGEVRALGEGDPAVASGVATFEVHPMPGTSVRPLPG